MFSHRLARTAKKSLPSFLYRRAPALMRQNGVCSRLANNNLIPPNFQRFFSLHRQSPTRRKFLEQHGSPQVAPQKGKGKVNKTKLMLVGANSVLFFGMSMWLLVIADRYFQNRERECIQKIHEQLYEDFGDLDEFSEKYADHPALGQCVVRQKSRELKQLFPLQIGEVVDVLVEGVGREGNLNIFRSRPQNSNEKPMIGLYPMQCLQRIKLPEDNDRNQNTNQQNLESS